MNIIVKIFIDSPSGGNLHQDACEAIHTVNSIFAREAAKEHPAGSEFSTAVGGELHRIADGRRLGSYVVEFGT